MQQDRLGADSLESSFDSRELRLLVNSKLKTSQQCACVTEQSNLILGCNSKNAVNILMKSIVNRITGWFGFEGTSELTQSHPLPWVAVPPAQAA